MALKSNWTKNISGFNTPAQLADAYIKVATITGSKEYASATVFVYKEKPVISDNPEDQIPFVPVDDATYSFKFSVADNAKNFIAQAYDYLKTLPEFSNALDC